MVRIIADKNIFDYGKKHPEFRASLEVLVSFIKGCNWEKPQDIVNNFGAKATDILKNQRVCIDVKGNHLRIIFKYQFIKTNKKTNLYVKWVGSHAEYDKLNNLGLQHTIDMFKKQ